MFIPPPTPEQLAKAEDLRALLADAQARFDAMTPEEQQAMLKRQKEGYVRAEMSWPRDCPYR